MIANVIIETTPDGGFGATMVEEIPGFILTGYGASVDEAKADFLEVYCEMKEIARQENESFPDLEFVYRYDMRSFFNYFDFLNVTKIAKRAGINDSLMRKYAAGIVKAGDAQYKKLKKAISEIANELHLAVAN